MSTSRKIFNYDDLGESKIVSGLTDIKKLYKNTISASGCLFYKLVKGALYLLLISYDDPKWNKLDDFGGRIDKDDDSVLDTIIRETSEETNGLIKKKMIVGHKHTIFYNKYSKYYGIAIEVPEDFFTDTSVFGNYEKTDNINRKIEWYEYSKNKSRLASRLLNNKDLILFLESKIDSDISIEKMFRKRII